MTEPRQPSRTRLVRPELFGDPETGMLTPAQRDCYLGLATVADDTGWMLWKPAGIAAAIYQYVSPAKRVRDLEQRSQALREVGLLEVLDCGCAFLPRAVRDLVIKGGTQLRTVGEHHLGHVNDAESRQVQTDTDKSRSLSLTSSSTSSLSLSGSQASSSSLDVAREAEPDANGRAKPNGSDGPFLGRKNGRPTFIRTNEDLPEHLRTVRST